VLVVTSTTGQGDLPDSIVPLYEGIKDMYQPHLRYGIIALGDSTYANFIPHNLGLSHLISGFLILGVLFLLIWTIVELYRGNKKMMAY